LTNTFKQTTLCNSGAPYNKGGNDERQQHFRIRSFKYIETYQEQHHSGQHNDHPRHRDLHWWGYPVPSLSELGYVFYCLFVYIIHNFHMGCRTFPVARKKIAKILQHTPKTTPAVITKLFKRASPFLN
jgi:hypothetical protein